jgi:soluble lytic murein transglycosylase
MVADNEFYQCVLLCRLCLHKLVLPVKLPVKLPVEPSLKYFEKTSITQASRKRQSVCFLALCLIALNTLIMTSSRASATELEQFERAWDAARMGDHVTFSQTMKTLQGYQLFPYLQYEDYRNRRGDVPVDEMSGFLNSHRDWAFSRGLRSTWLKTLAKKGRWADLVAHSGGVTETVLRCQRVRGQIILKQTDGVLSEAQKLWTVGKSQPDECDPLFGWLIKNNGITESLAWERIRLAMTAGNRDLTGYLKRFVPENQRRWLEDWHKLSRFGFTRLERASGWPENEITRMIAATSLQRLARIDSGTASKKFQILDSHFNWGELQRAAILRDIALYSAVDLENDTPRHMARVPVKYRDTQLLEWWTRYLLSRQDWPGVATVIGQMPEETRNDDRWLYWLAQADLRSGQSKTSSEPLAELAHKANYYGFLAADELGLAYNICSRQPDIDAAGIERIAGIDGFKRALELRKAGLNNWATEEWTLATSRLIPSELKGAAALANRENWHDRVIFALGNSGDLDFYEWRFPLIWEKEIKREAAANNLDPAWVYGTIRSESAMQETARSSANALGLMQITPATGKRVARKYSLAWSGRSQLKTVAGNLPIGTAYMSELLQDYRNNPVLVSGSYNAGPNAVNRWLDNRPMGEAAIWVETLPYFETRDYIPRVLAFTTLYEWRLGRPVKRISARMPHIESGKISVNGSTNVVCKDTMDEVDLRN